MYLHDSVSRNFAECLESPIWTAFIVTSHFFRWYIVWNCFLICISKYLQTAKIYSEERRVRRKVRVGFIEFSWDGLITKRAITRQRIWKTLLGGLKYRLRSAGFRATGSAQGGDSFCQKLRLSVWIGNRFDHRNEKLRKRWCSPTISGMCGSERKTRFWICTWFLLSYNLKKCKHLWAVYCNRLSCSWHF